MGRRDVCHCQARHVQTSHLEWRPLPGQWGRSHGEDAFVSPPGEEHPADFPTVPLPAVVKDYGPIFLSSLFGTLWDLSLCMVLLELPVLYS